MQPIQERINLRKENAGAVRPRSATSKVATPLHGEIAPIRLLSPRTEHPPQAAVRGSSPTRAVTALDPHLRKDRGFPPNASARSFVFVWWRAPEIRREEPSGVHASMTPAVSFAAMPLRGMDCPRQSFQRRLNTLTSVGNAAAQNACVMPFDPNFDLPPFPGLSRAAG